MLKLKCPCFGHLMQRADSLEKTLMLGKIEGRRRKEWQRMRWLDTMTQLNGHEFEQTPGDLLDRGSEPTFPVLAGSPFSDSCCSVTQSCSHVPLCNHMDSSMPSFLILHYLPEPAQTHVHWVGDTIQPSHPLLSPSPPALNLSQHQGLF